MNSTNKELFVFLKQNSETLNKKYFCAFTPNKYQFNNSCKNDYIWQIDVFGKGSYKNKEILKSFGLFWNSYRKTWTKDIDIKDVPIEIIIMQKKSEMEEYNINGLTYPYCKPKCKNKGCNNEKQNYCKNGTCVECEHLMACDCPECSYKKKCVGGLDCNGWLTIPCKHNKKTLKGFTFCQGCFDDSTKWAKAMPFANDNS